MIPAKLEVPAPEEAGPELGRWGLSFVSPEVERGYLSWQIEQTIPFNRTGVAGAIGIWAVQTVSCLLFFRNGFAPWAAANAVVVSLMVLALVAMRRQGFHRWSQALTALANCMAGIEIVCLMPYYFHMPQMAAASGAIALYFAFCVLRVRPLQAVLATLPYTFVYFRMISEMIRSSQLTFVETIVCVIPILMAYATGVQSSLVNDIVMRRSYRQELIIAAQKRTISREHARSEALLQQELSHQVAERSKELGAALAKSEVALELRQLSPGERFDTRYKVVAPLGAGAMGAVYEVERITDGERLALKAILGNISGTGAARFAREAEIGARIRHPNLVSIVDVGISAGVPFLVMELVRGSSLEEERSHFGDPAWAIPILAQITQGLVALHQAGVVHRDLKPANVLLAEGSSEATARIAKIADFGISRFGPVDHGATGLGSNATAAANLVDPNAPTLATTPREGLALTRTGMILGTPLYMAPEAARGGDAVDARSDVFTLGIIAYELLTGRNPFAIPPVILAVAQQPIPPAPPIGDDRVSRALEQLIQACLSAVPAERPKLTALLQALQG